MENIGIKYICKMSVMLISAMSHLDKVKVFGKQIRVMASKHQSVQMPKEGQPVRICKLPCNFFSSTYGVLHISCFVSS